MPLCQNGIKQFLYIRKCCHEHIFTEIRLQLFNMVSNEAFYDDTNVRKKILIFGKWSLHICNPKQAILFQKD